MAVGITRWTGVDARLLRQALRVSVRNFAEDTGIPARTISRWEAGGAACVPRPVHQAVLDTVLSTADQTAQTLFATLRDTEGRSEQIGAESAVGSSGDLPAQSERQLVMAAAHAASKHAAWTEATNVGPVTLDQLDADVLRIANDYVHVAPLPMFADMQRVRTRVYRLLDGHQRPADTAHLYLVAGALSGLLANVSTDLGYHDAAGEQARSAWA